MVDQVDKSAVSASAPVARSGVVDILRRFFDSDVWYSFKSSPITIFSGVITLIYFIMAVFGPWIAPHDPFDLAGLSLMDSLLPPAWMEYGEARFPLGTDDQGRDLLSAIIYGSRVSLFIGFASVILAMVMGITLGLISGFVGGAVDAFIMRAAEIQLSFPSILIALLINGIVIGYFKTHPEWQVDQVTLAYFVLVLSIGLSNWVQYARTVRGSTLVERNKEYVQAAHVIGIHPAMIMWRHILPNVLGPVLVIATIQLALAIITEATLSFLGVGVPPTEPSLGTLIRVGNDYLFSGEWWITIFPGAALAILVLAVNLLGDWLRDALNPKLR